MGAAAEGDKLAEGEIEALSELEGEIEALTLALTLGLTDGLTLGETLGLSDADGLILGETEAETEGETEGEILGLTLELGIVNVPPPKSSNPTPTPPLHQATTPILPAAVYVSSSLVPIDPHPAPPSLKYTVMRLSIMEAPKSSPPAIV